MALHGAETWDASGSRSEIPGKFWDVVLEKEKHVELIVAQGASTETAHFITKQEN